MVAINKGRGEEVRKVCEIFKDSLMDTLFTLEIEHFRPMRIFFKRLTNRCFIYKEEVGILDNV